MGVILVLIFFCIIFGVQPMKRKTYPDGRDTVFVVGIPVYTAGTDTTKVVK